MTKKSATLTVLMGALGFLTGYVMHRSPSDHHQAAAPASVAKPVSSDHDEALTVAEPKPARAITLHSTETLQSLIDQGQAPTYATLALWLLDASSDDIAAYWNFRKNGPLDGDKQRLIFVSWTRIDPQSAIAAAAGTDHAKTPWWAWAGHDPQAALSAAGPDRIKDVARGIGEFQPKWLREHFDLIPEEAREQALIGLTTWKEDSDHVASLDFLQAQGAEFPTHIFRTLALKDPFQAFDWLQKNNKLDPKDRGPLDILINAMSSGPPEGLERLAAMTPSGPLRWKIEDAVFANLLAADPQAARDQAKSIEAPLVSVKRLAQIGDSLLASDPEQAFEIGAEIFATSPSKLDATTRVEIDTSSWSWSSEKSTTSAFMESLLIKDPQRTMAMITSGSDKVSSTFQQLSGQWVKRDLPAYADWVNQQTDPTVRDAGAGLVVNQLSSQGQFQEAAVWAMSGSTANEGALYSLALQWGQQDKAQASTWLDSAKLPEPLKKRLRSYINHNQ